MLNRYRKSLLVLFAATAWAAGKPAKNVVLFLGDAAGIPTLNAGSIQAYGEPAKLFIQHMPYLALSETSSASDWITDSAAGMTAIVTGQKTNNGVLSESVRHAESGVVPLKTILEYAEAHGLSTGVISNSPMWDATPAACYAHASSRKLTGAIFSQILKPRFGDGVDIVFGPGRKAILAATSELGLDLGKELHQRGVWFSDSLRDVPAGARRAIVLTDDADFDITAATRAAIAMLSKNPKGFFLMVESDLHTVNLRRGLERVPKFDYLIGETARKLHDNSLVLFTADHSFDLRTSAALPKGQPLFTLDASGQTVPSKGVMVYNRHSGEQVLVAAEGPGAERVHGFLENTDLFRIMMAAYGWKEDPHAPHMTGTK